MSPEEHLTRSLEYCDRAEAMAARALPPISIEGIQRELVLAQIETVRASVESMRLILKMQSETEERKRND